MRERELFIEALQKEAAVEREAYLAAACGGDADLRQRVDQLLVEHERHGTFLLDKPPPGVGNWFAAGAAIPGTRIGMYTLREQIAEGGMGVVFRAEQSEPVARQVALKIIKPGMDTQQVLARFEAERQALALMDHPNIARVLDAGATATGHPYFVMEFVAGQPIAKYCDDKQLDIRQRLELMIPVCQAIQHAHQKGIIHRDIKPSNILVAEYDGHPVPKIIDFGVSKAIAQRLSEQSVFTLHGQIIGTLEYMSPEQAGLGQHDIDTRSDVYSLGVLLYELLTGTTPFDKHAIQAAAFHEVLRIIREEEPAKPSTKVGLLDALPSVAATRGTEPARLTQTLRGELDWIAMKALEKDRDRRYETASSLAIDLQRYLANEPVLAGPPTAMYRFRKFLRRHASFIATAALILVALGSLGATLAVHYWGIAAHRTQTAQHVQYALSAARSAAHARDLTLAELHLAEARGRLGNLAPVLADAADAIDGLTKEVNARRSDDERFARFMQLANEGSDNMSYNNDEEGCIPAKQALEIFSVLSDADWLGRLHQSYLTTEQKNQVQETAYQTLVTLADYGVRWRHQWLAIGEEPPVTNLESIDLLDRAERFHEPTRALWYVRREAYRQLKDQKRAQECDQQFKAAKATCAWDHYLPGHSASWARRVEEAIESYQAALRIEPDHFNSLFFLADRLGWAKIKRGAESIQLFRACIALKPHHPYAYRYRAKLFENQKKLAEAEADYSAAISAVNNDYDRFFAYHHRREYYQRTNRPKLAQADLQQQVLVGERFLNDQEGTLGPSSLKVINIKSQLVSHYTQLRRYDEAIALGQQVVAWRQSHHAIANTGTLVAMNHLTVAYRGAGRLDEAATLGDEVVSLARKRFGSKHEQLPTYLACLGNVHAWAGNWEKAAPRYEEALTLLKTKAGRNVTSTLTLKNSLAKAYRNTGRPDKASVLFRELLDAKTQQLGPQHTETLATAALLGGTLLEQKDYPEAEAVLRQCLADSEKNEPDRWTTFHRQSLLGAVLVGQATNLIDSDPPAAELKLVEAERLLTEGYEGLKARQLMPSSGANAAKPSGRLSDSVHRLIDLYTLWGKPEQAAPWKKVLEDLSPDTQPQSGR